MSSEAVVCNSSFTGSGNSGSGLAATLGRGSRLSFVMPLALSICMMISAAAARIACTAHRCALALPIGTHLSRPRRSQNPGRTFCSDRAGKDSGNDDAVLGGQLWQFGACYAQRVCHSVEEVDLQHVDLGVAFDDIRQCLHDRDSVRGFELAPHAAQVFAQID